MRLKRIRKKRGKNKERIRTYKNLFKSNLATFTPWVRIHTFFFYHNKTCTKFLAIVKNYLRQNTSGKTSKNLDSLLMNPAIKQLLIDFPDLLPSDSTNFIISHPKYNIFHYNCPNSGHYLSCGSWESPRGTGV